MADLTDAQKVFIVVRRARFVDIADVRTQFEETFGEKITSAQVSGYDATNVHGQERMGKTLQELFRKERKAYLAEEDTVSIGSPVFRLKELEKMYFAPTISGLPKPDKIRLQILEQAAKEKGGLYQTRVSEQEAFDYVVALAQKAREAVDTHVTNASERNRVHADIKKDVEGQGAGSPS